MKSNINECACIDTIMQGASKKVSTVRLSWSGLSHCDELPLCNDNPFKAGSPAQLMELMSSIGSGHGNELEDRPAELLFSVLSALCYLRDKGEVGLSIQEVRNYMTLDKLIELSHRPDISESGVDKVNDYLSKLPNYVDLNKCSQGESYCEAHNYYASQLALIMSKAESMYGHLADDNYLAEKPSSGEKKISVDFSAIMVNSDGKCRSENDFVYYGNTSSPCGSVRINGSSLSESNTEKESISIRLLDIDEDIEKVYFVASIHDGVKDQSCLRMLGSVLVGFYDSSNKHILSFDLDGSIGDSVAIIAATAVKSKNGWCFLVPGRGYDGGLISILKEVGLA